MAASAEWSAHKAVAAIQPQPWKSHAWRFHHHRYSATDASGSLQVSGRYHRASREFPEDQSWVALYLALSPEASLGEVMRHFGPDLLPQLNEYRLTELDVEVEAVLDCRDARALGLAADALVGDYDFTVTREIAAAAIAKEAEGILVPSATGLGENLVVFASQLRSSSRLAVVESRDARLYIPR